MRALFRQNLVWHVAMPKSGSSWLDLVLGNGLVEDFGFRTDRLSSGGGYREQEFCVKRFRRARFRGRRLYFLHQHCGFSAYVAQQCMKRDVKIILQVRSIPDCIVSIVDHWRRETAVGPIAYLKDADVRALSVAEQQQLAVDVVAPWYFRFWAGWNDALRGAVPGFEKQIHLVRYEDLLRDPVSGFLRAAQFCDPRVTEEQVRDWMARADAGQRSSKANKMVRTMRKNVAQTGRGKTLPPELRVQLEKFRRYYPTTDFSPVLI